MFNLEWKILAFVFIVAMILMGIMTGNAFSEDRFEVIYDQTSAFARIRVLKDKVTGQEYLYYKLDDGAGLTRMKMEDDYDLKDFKNDLGRKFRDLPFSKK